MSDISSTQSHAGQNASTSSVSTSAPSRLHSEIQYEVPSWLQGHIKTIEELKRIEAKIFVSDEASERNGPSSASGNLPPPHQDDQHGRHPREKCFVVKQDELDNLLDSAASLQLPDPRRLPSGRRCTIVLHTRMCQGFRFLDELVLKMAKEMGCSVLSLSPYELHEISVTFKDQADSATKQRSTKNAEVNPREDIPSALESVDKPLSQIFGSRSFKNAGDGEAQRVRNAITALLNAVQTKVDELSREQTREESAKQEATSESSTSKKPDLFVYLRDFTILDQELAKNIICRIRDVIMERRQSGQRITLVIGLTHTDLGEDWRHRELWKTWSTSECGRFPCVCERGGSYDYRFWHIQLAGFKLGASGPFYHSITPTKVPENWNSVSVIDWPASRMVARVNMLQRRLYRHLGQLPSSPEHLLDEDDSLFSAFSDSFRQIFIAGTDWPWNEEVEALYSRALGRCLRRRRVDLAEILDILRRGKGYCRPTKPNKESKTVPPTTEEQVQKQWQEDLSVIARTCTPRERLLLPHVINPARFTTIMNEVVLDQDVIVRITNLVKLSRLQSGTTSKGLLSQFRGSGALLYGPPGTGKTHLARAVAKSTGSKYLMAVDAATINNQHVGETEKTIASIFSLASKLFPCIIFLDEVDALFFRRSGDDKSWQRANITQFLQSMDGLLKHDNSAFLIAATNRPMDLDTAFLRRLPHKIAFDLPNETARGQILRLFLPDEDLDGVDVDSLAAATEGFSGSDLKNLCGQAALMWVAGQTIDVEKDAEECKVLLTMDHFKKALTHTRPTVSQSDLFEMRRFKQRYSLETPIGFSDAKQPAPLKTQELEPVRTQDEKC